MDPAHHSAELPSRHDSCDQDQDLQLTLHHHGNPVMFSFSQNATVTHLSQAIESDLSIPSSHQKLLITPNVGLLKPPFKNASLPLTSLLSKKIVLLGTSPSEIASLDAAVSKASTQRASPRPFAAKAAPRKPTQDAGKYTFLTLRPLPYLPNPARSTAYLAHLRDDPGIQHVMQQRKWTVPLLTEMNPVEHTTAQSRTLGLNRNKGEVIELRLRTDAYDGYRDYKTIRKTLCHELAHIVHSEHDADFWRLCREIERDVERADWKGRGGRWVGEADGYVPPDELARDEDEVDEGGWQGGEYVLGGGAPAATHAGEGDGGREGSQLSRREILARAAEERARRSRDGIS